MIEFDGAFEAGKAVLGLVGEARKLLEKLDKQGQQDPTLGRLLDQLRSRAIQISHQVESDLADLRRDLEDAGVNIDRSIDDLLRDTRWYQWITRSRLHDFLDRFRKMEDYLRVLIDDVTALLLCSGRIHETEQAFAEARQEKIALLTRSSVQTRVVELFRHLIELSTELSKRLEARA